MRDWFKARNIWGGAILTLSDAEAGRLAKALWQYTMTGEEAELPGAVGAIFAMFLMTLRQDVEAENDLSAKRAAAGSKGGNQKVANVAIAKLATTDIANVANTTIKNKNKDKEKDIDNDDDNARVRETAFGEVEEDPVIISVQSNLTGLTVTHYNELAHFREILGDDLVIHAIDETVGNSARSWNYTKAILEDYVRGNVRTVGEAKERSEKRKRKHTQAQTYTQRQYSEADLEARITEL